MGSRSEANSRRSLAVLGASALAVGLAAWQAPAAFRGIEPAHAGWIESSSDAAERTREPRDVELIAQRVTFAPSNLRAVPGEVLRVTLRNLDDEQHGLEFKMPDGKVGLEGVVDPRDSAVLELTAPGRPGKYDFYCTVGDHRARGQRGTLEVTRDTQP